MQSKAQSRRSLLTKKRFSKAEGDKKTIVNDAKISEVEPSRLSLIGKN